MTSIIIKNLEHECYEALHWVNVEFSLDGEEYRNSLEDGRWLNRDSLGDELDSETMDAVQEALDAYIEEQNIDTEPYDIDELTEQAQVLGYRIGKRYVLDQIGESVELVEVNERYRQRVTAFNSHMECSVWLYEQLNNNPLLEEGPVKRVNANIPKLLHDDFKALCVRRGIDMQDVLTTLIIGWMR